MASVFTKIINGELPGRFIYRDDSVVAFLTIEPIAYGHTLVIPIEEVDKWTDLPDDIWQHCNEVSKKIGNAIINAFGSPRCGYMIAGFEVPHTHIHLFPAWDMSGYDLSTIMKMDETDPEKMDEAAAKIRAELRTMGVDHVADED